MALPGLDSLVCYLRKVTPAGEDGDDGQLLARFATGDEVAFAALVHRYAGLVWGVCRRALPRVVDAEDAFQATFLVLLKQARSLRRAGPLGPFLHRVASRTSVKARVRAARQASRDRAAAVPEVQMNADDSGGELREVIDEEVAHLPEKYRLPVVLCYLEGMTNEQAADRLGCPRGTILSRLSRAREQLRRRLARRGADLPAFLPAALPAVPPALVEAVLRGGPVVRDGAFSTSVLTLAEGVLFGMSLHKLRLAALAILTLAVLAGAGVWAGRPAVPGSAPPVKKVLAQATEKKTEDRKPAPAVKLDDKKEEKDDKTPQMARTATEVRDNLRKPGDFGGSDDPKATLQELLILLSKIYQVKFDVDETAFKVEMLNDVLKTEVSNPPLEAMNATPLAFVLKKILTRVPVPSGATFLIRKDHIEITTGQAVFQELGVRKIRVKQEDPQEAVDDASPPALSPLVWEDLKKVRLDKALRDIGEDTGVTIVLDPRTESKSSIELTTTLRNVPVEAAVETLADMAGLSVVYRNNVLYVTSPENAERLLKSRRWFAEPQRRRLQGANAGAAM
jgi:RNA polymerase sigma factor (sigma-70 family)